MNNTKNILLMAAITSLLIMGTSIVPMQSYADRDNDNDKKTNDFKPSISASYESDKKSASQHQDQDNFCYRGDNECEQANQGQQIAGKDNEVTGFTDQSENIQQSLIPIQPGTGTGNGTTPTPTPKTCVECITTLLTTPEINEAKRILFGTGSHTDEQLCNLLGSLSAGEVINLLEGSGVDPTIVTKVIECLRSVGTISGP